MSDNRRWLIKALREAANELQDQIGRTLLDQDAPPEARAAAAEAAKELAKQETIAAHQIAHLLYANVEDLPLHPYEWLEEGPEGTPWDHLHLYADLRDQITTVLSTLSDREWDRTARHRFRGPLCPIKIARQVHDDDLSALALVINRITAILPHKPSRT